MDGGNRGFGYFRMVIIPWISDRFPHIHQLLSETGWHHIPAISCMRFRVGWSTLESKSKCSTSTLVHFFLNQSLMFFNQSLVPLFFQRSRVNVVASRPGTTPWCVFPVFTSCRACGATERWRWRIARCCHGAGGAGEVPPRKMGDVSQPFRLWDDFG